MTGPWRFAKRIPVSRMTTRNSSRLWKLDLHFRRGAAVATARRKLRKRLKLQCDAFLSTSRSKLDCAFPVNDPPKNGPFSRARISSSSSPGYKAHTLPGLAELPFASGELRVGAGGEL